MTVYYMPTIYQVDSGVKPLTEEDLEPYAKTTDINNLRTLITELSQAIQAKANSGHTHQQSDIEQLAQSLLSKLDVGRYSYNTILSDSELIAVLNNPKLIKFSVGDNGNYTIEINEHGYLTCNYNNSRIGFYDIVSNKWTFNGISQVGHTHSMNDITDLIVSSHNHTINDIIDLQTTLNGKAASTHTHSYSSLTNIPSTFTPSTHTHSMSDITDLIVSSHNHTISDITDFPATMPPSTHTHSYSSLTNIPSTFTPSTHTHDSISDSNISLTVGNVGSDNNGLLLSTGASFASIRFAGGNSSVGPNYGIITYRSNGYAPDRYLTFNADGSEGLRVYKDKVQIPGNLTVSGNTTLNTLTCSWNTTLNTLTCSGTTTLNSVISNGSIQLFPFVRDEEDEPDHKTSQSIYFRTTNCFVQMQAIDDTDETFTSYDDEHCKLSIYLFKVGEGGHNIFLTYNNDVIKNETIKHTALMSNANEFETLQIGEPVFIDGNTYKIVKSQSGASIGHDEFVSSTSNDSSDCVPGITITGDYRTFIGVCVKKYSIGDKLLMGNGIKRCVEFSQNCVEFATHGDFVFKVNDTSNMNVGDTILYDGTILNDLTALNNKINRSIVGVITKIYDSNYLAVFKCQ